MITPVLICGGPEKRLWPLSRASYPKQFVPLIGNDHSSNSTIPTLKPPRAQIPEVELRNLFQLSCRVARESVEPGSRAEVGQTVEDGKRPRLYVFSDSEPRLFRNHK